MISALSTHEIVLVVITKYATGEIFAYGTIPEICKMYNLKMDELMEMYIATIYDCDPPRLFNTEFIVMSITTDQHTEDAIFSILNEKRGV